MTLPRVTIAGTGSGSGKTTVAMGVISALTARGLAVQPYKAGADRVDPGYHTAASGRPCRNLDTMLLPRDRLLELFSRSAPREGISVIEGVMGLFDGAGPRDERGSTAHLTKVLAAPVILAADGRGMGRSAAALVAGFSRFDTRVPVRGVIFTNIGGERHFRLLKEAVEGDTGVPVLGCLPRRESLVLPGRRMGLVPADLNPRTSDLTDSLGRLAEEWIDLEAVVILARSAPPLPDFEPSLFTSTAAGRAVIAVARDEAFCFCRQDSLDILEHLGAEIRCFSPLKDSALPEGAGGVYMEGDFPDEFASLLAANEPLKKAVRESADRGMPILAGAGGLVWLAERLVDREGKVHPMVGVLPGTVKTADTLTLGYRDGWLDRDALPGCRGMKLRGRLFHYLDYDPEGEESIFSLTLTKDGTLSRDGPARKNVFASFLGLHLGTDPEPAARLIKAAALYGKK